MDKPDASEPCAIEETRHAVYRWPGPGMYRGELAGRRGFVPRHCELSLPPEHHEQAAAAGFRFIRWARGSDIDCT